MGPSTPPGSELAALLERTFRLLGKRIYRPSVRRTHGGRPGLDNASIPLLATMEAQGELRPSDIAAALELDQSTVSRQLRQLEQVGLVVRRADSGDGRVSQIRLTEEGRASLAAVRATRARMLDDVFAGWPEADRRQLNTLLERLLDGLAALPTGTTPTTPPTPPTQTNDAPAANRESHG